jgi:hypothetical protein
MKGSIKYQKFDHSASNFIYYVDNKNNRYIYHSFDPYSKWKTRVYEFVFLRFDIGIDIKFGIRIRKLLK